MKRAVVIFGPTATGKTDLAIKLAKKFGGELISADSRQVYKHLDIGTGKVSPSSMVKKQEEYWIVDGIKIHGFDLRNPEQNFSAADFVKFANITMIHIIEAEKLPIIVGGTGFYIKSLIEGIGTLGIPADKKLRRQFEKSSPADLFAKLAKINPSRANSMNKSDRANPRRLVRAIEIAIYNENQLPSNHPTIQPSNHLLIGLSAPNKYLYQRADNWLNARFKIGMVAEVKKLIKAGIDLVWLESLGLEYRWLTKFVLGQAELDFATERLKGDIHDFIRRQKTFFRQFQDLKLFNITEKGCQKSVDEEVAQHIRLHEAQG